MRKADDVVFQAVSGCQAIGCLRQGCCSILREGLLHRASLRFRKPYGSHFREKSGILGGNCGPGTSFGRVGPRALAHGPSQRPVIEQSPHVLVQPVRFAMAHRNLDHNVVRVLDERADFGNQSGFAERQGPQQTAGGLADGGPAQVEADVAGRDPGREILERHVARDPDRAFDAEFGNQRTQRAVRVLLADQHHARLGVRRA